MNGTPKRRFLASLVGDRAFYRTLMAVSLPIMLQNGITQFIGMLDNVMIGRIGTEQMSGVSIVNQLLLVFNLCIFGAVSGAGLFGAQFYGKRDHDGVRHTFRFQLYFTFLLLGATVLTFVFAGDSLIGLYLHEGDGVGDLALTERYAKEYLSVILWGLLPSVVTQCYAGTLRNIGQTVQPMVAGFVGVGTNLILNYLLIFGKLGFPAMGVVGAAIATNVSRVAEMVYLVVWTHRHSDRCEFIKGAFRSLRVPTRLTKDILRTGFPLMLNETLWAAGQAVILQCFSYRGVDVVSAMNISNTVSTTFAMFYISVGSAIAILIGHRLGAGEQEAALADAKKMIAFAFVVGVGCALLISLCAPFFPFVYNTSDGIRALATGLTFVIAGASLFDSVMNACYFTLRSGGKTLITFLFDSAYVWVVSIPVALLLTRATALPILIVYLIVRSIDAGKATLGVILVNKGIWLNTIVGEKKPTGDRAARQE